MHVLLENVTLKFMSSKMEVLFEFAGEINSEINKNTLPDIHRPRDAPEQEASLFAKYEEQCARGCSLQADEGTTFKMLDKSYQIPGIYCPRAA